MKLGELLKTLGDYGADVVLMPTLHDAAAQQQILAPTTLLEMMGKAHTLTLEVDATIDAPLRNAVQQANVNNPLPGRKRSEDVSEAAETVVLQGLTAFEQRFTNTAADPVRTQVRTAHAHAIAEAVSYANNFGISVRPVDDATDQVARVAAHLGIPEQNALDHIIKLPMHQQQALHHTAGWRDDTVMAANIDACIDPSKSGNVIANIGIGHTGSVYHKLTAGGRRVAALAFAADESDLQRIYAFGRAAAASGNPITPPIYCLSTGKVTMMDGTEVTTLAPGVFGLPDPASQADAAPVVAQQKPLRAGPLRPLDGQTPGGAPRAEPEDDTNG